jgi:hypothetical protein
MGSFLDEHAERKKTTPKIYSGPDWREKRAENNPEQNTQIPADKPEKAVKSIKTSINFPVMCTYKINY